MTKVLFLLLLSIAFLKATDCFYHENGYHFELKEFNYDESIKISVNEVNE